MKKTNNKGFSLVELIVVVLIMGILAVALTPQVMKWVEKSRVSTDNTTLNTFVSDCQVAMTNTKAYKEVVSSAVGASDLTITISHAAPSGITANSEFDKALKAVIGKDNYNDFILKQKDASVDVTISHTTGAVTVGTKNNWGDLSEAEDN